MNRLEHILSMQKEDPSDPFLIYAEALERIKLEEIDVAIDLLKRLEQDHAEYLATYYQLGKLLEMNGEIEYAQRAYQSGVAVAKRQGDRKILGELNEALLMIED